MSTQLDLITLLNTFSFDKQVIPSLPPDLRDRLLDALELWGDAEEQLTFLDLLRQAHGPLLTFLDYQVQALLKAGKLQQALEIVERRQRRSSSVISQSIEATLLLALGHTIQARSLADELNRTYSRNLTALVTAAQIYAATDSFEQAQQLLEQYLAQRPSDIQASLALAQLAQRAGQRSLAEQYVQRLGGGVSADIDTSLLRQLLDLFVELGNQQSVQAIQVELERRRQIELQSLQRLLAPFLASATTEFSDPEEFYRRLHGPESIQVQPDEQRRIQLDAVRHFGFMKLRNGQIETIATIGRGESLLTVMPTGGGKSLCYQLPALTMGRSSLVISPLIALMKDQVEGLPAAARAKATFINSTLTDEELATRMAGVARGDYKLIYAAPERLRQREFLRALRSAGLDLFVIDEAHCVSMWGHDFRPDYLFVQEARKELGNPPTLAMTATAPPLVRDEIVDYIRTDANIADAVLEIATEHRRPLPRVITLDIFRNNLHLSSVKFNNEEEKLAALLKYVQDNQGSGVVYANSRHRCESLAYQLQQEGVTAEAYHAGRDDRGAVQDRFMKNETRVVVATVAFGMGIDKSNIRFIVHFHPPRSLASYYQEVGRAGRDGKPSEGVLFFSNNDWTNLRRWAKSDEYGVDFLERVYTAAATQLGIEISPPVEAHGDELPTPDEPIEKSVAQLASHNSQSVIGPVDARRLQQVLNTDETTVRVAISMLERADLLSRGFDLPQEIAITIPVKVQVTPAPARNAQYSRLLKGLALRSGQTAAFKTSDLSTFMRWPIHEVERNLLDWQAEGLLTVKGSKRVMTIEMAPKPDDLRDRVERLLTQSVAVAQRRIDEMVGYATAESCRHGYISAHFGSPPRSKCDVCDNCTGKRPELPVPETNNVLLPDDSDIEPMIIDCLLSLPKPMGRSGLARILVGSLRAPATPDKARHHGRLKALGEAAIMQFIDDMLEDSRLRQFDRQGYMVLAATLRGRAEAESWLSEHSELNHYGPAPEPSETTPEVEAAETEKYTGLQKALWLWRRNLAAQLGQPTYLIMSNELMLRIAETRPPSLEELARLPGMGAQRMEYYGKTILDLVKLNPLHAGDEGMLTAQRLAQAEEPAQKERGVTDTTQSSPSTNVKISLAPAISPQMERKILMKLQEIRQKKAIGERVKTYEIAGNALIESIARRAPASISELEAIPGFVNSRLRQDAEQILTFIHALRSTK